MRPFLILAIVLLSLASVSAQATHTPSLTPTPSPLASPGRTPVATYATPQSVANASPRYQGRSEFETQLGWGVLAFGFLITSLQVLVMLRLKKGWGTQSIRVVGLTLVLTSGLFLIVTGYSQEQIAPMIGLLGTITGFLLGKTASAKETE